MRTGKMWALVVGGLAALLVFSAIAVSVLINPNEYKPRLVAAVRKATGRELGLEGNIRLSLFPWVALEFGPASLSNPPGYTSQPFLSLNRVSLRLRLLPLLARRLEFGEIEIDGLDVRLARDGSGRGNWQARDTNGTNGRAALNPGTGVNLSLADITAVKLVDASLSYEDLRLDHIEVETGAFAEHGIVPVTVHVKAVFDGNATATADVRFDLGVDDRSKQLSVAALNANGEVSFAGNPRPVRLSLTSPRIDVDLAARTLAAADLALDVAGAHLRLAVQGAGLGSGDDRRFSGNVVLAPLELREFLPRIGMDPPLSRDPKVWSRVEASSRFTVADHELRLDEVKATLDDTHFSGSVGLVNLAARAITFDLAADHIDLDRYLAPAAQVSQQTEPPDAPTPTAPPPPAPIDATGTFRLTSLHLGLMDLSNVAGTLAAHDRVMHLFPVSAQIDGGRYSGDMTLDRREPVPTLTLDQHLTGIDLGQLLGEPPKPGDSSKHLRLSGRGSLNLTAVGRGVGADSILKSLKGHFDARLADGAWEGVDLGHEFGRANAFLNHDGGATSPDTHRTAFNACNVAADIANGVATTHDLLIESVVLKITGQGTLNLATQAVDLKLLADTKKSLGGAALRIPLELTGTLTDPSVRADVAALTQGKLKDKVKEALKDKLLSLFGKP